ncbi:MAG: PIG-L deacetylase family protein, partial [Chthoniobacterales bacterium]
MSTDSAIQAPLLPGRLYVPDEIPAPECLERITHLGVGAHHDDLEFMAFHGIVECLGKADQWFGGVTCTDGKGSSRNGAFAGMSPEELAQTRSEEQLEAARIGAYGAMIQLDHPSARATNPADPTLRDELFQILRATRPGTVYTHNPADKHATHIGVFAALLQALRLLPAEERPVRCIGCEVWRDLDWMGDSEKIRMDVSGHEALAEKLNAVFVSQIAGGKRYDLAVTGRRAANATFHEPREGDTSTQILLGMDLSPLLRDDSLDPVE